MYIVLYSQLQATMYIALDKLNNEKGITKMKIIIDKQYTTLAQLPIVKEKVKQFKASYSDRDLLNEFVSAMDDIGRYEYTSFIGEIVKCEVSAFPSDMITDKMSYSVYISIEGPWNFMKVHFYLAEKDSGALEVDCRQDLYYVKEFVEK